MRMADTHQEHSGIRHTVVIDDALLREAQQALGTPSIRATIEHSLRETIRRRRLRESASTLGTFELTLTSEEYLAQKRHEAMAHAPGDREYAELDGGV